VVSGDIIGSVMRPIGSCSSVNEEDDIIGKQIEGKWKQFAGSARERLGQTH